MMAVFFKQNPIESFDSLAFFRTCQKNVGSNFVKDIVALPEIIECYNIAGDYDFMLKILVEDMSSYQDFVMNKLSTIENIGNTQSVFVMGEIKHSTALSI